jgi:hypothetical protein
MAHPISRSAFVLHCRRSHVERRSSVFVAESCFVMAAHPKPEMISDSNRWHLLSYPNVTRPREK